MNCEIRRINLIFSFYISQEIVSCRWEVFTKIEKRNPHFHDFLRKIAAVKSQDPKNVQQLLFLFP